MKFKLEIFVFLLCLSFLNAQNLLKNYLLDDSDLSYANYNLKQTTNFPTYTVYTLNVTSLKWFDGKLASHRKIYYLTVKKLESMWFKFKWSFRFQYSVIS